MKSRLVQERAMLVGLSISSWTASKKDNKASTAVKQQHGAAAKAGWYNKRLIDSDALLPIGKVEGRLREYHYSQTLPWADNGERMLPGASFFEYAAKMRELKAEFETAVQAFVAVYPQLVQDARAMLGTMYEPGDYPDVQDIRRRFSVKTTFTPVPDAEDFRVDLGDDAVNEIRENITNAVNERMKGALRECWVRLDEVVGKLHERLDDPKAVFKDTLITNVEVLVELLPKLNITNEPELTGITARVRAQLLAEKPERLRRNKTVRAQVAASAKLILDEVKWQVERHGA